MFTHSVEKPNRTVDVIDKEKEQCQLENRHVLHFIAKAVLYLGKQCLPLHGAKDKLSCVNSPGNF